MNIVKLHFYLHRSINIWRSTLLYFVFDSHSQWPHRGNILYFKTQIELVNHKIYIFTNYLCQYQPFKLWNGKIILKLNILVLCKICVKENIKYYSCMYQQILIKKRVLWVSIVSSRCRRRLKHAANTWNVDKYREIERKETNVMEITDRECNQNWTVELIF